MYRKFCIFEIIKNIFEKKFLNKCSKKTLSKERKGCSHAKEAIAWRNSVNDVSINDKKVRQKNKNDENVKIHKVGIQLPKNSLIEKKGEKN